MKSYRAAQIITATPDVIWGILTDASHYPNWDPTIDKLEGQIALGQKIAVFSKLRPNQPFLLTVTEWVPERRMVWRGGMPLGLFAGERTFTLSPQSGSTTEFSMQEVLSGLLLPLFGNSVPDLTPVFEQFVAALKAQAEK